MRTHIKTSTAFPALVAALAIAGCGGGGDGPTVRIQQPTEVSLASLIEGRTVAPGVYRITGNEESIAAVFAALGSEAEISSEGVDVAETLNLKCSGTGDCGIAINQRAGTVTVTVTGTIEVTAAQEPETEPTGGTSSGSGGGGSTTSGGGSTGTTSTTTTTPSSTTDATAFDRLLKQIQAVDSEAKHLAALDALNNVADGSLTQNQRDALFALVQVFQPSEGEESNRDLSIAAANRLIAAGTVADLNGLLDDSTENRVILGNVDIVVTDLYEAWEDELSIRETVFSRFTDPNVNDEGETIGFRPSPVTLGTVIESGAVGRYGVWMDPNGLINRWERTRPEVDLYDPIVFYSRDEIRSIAAGVRSGFVVDGVPSRATYSGTASGFAARTDETAGEMKADVALTLSFGIDSDEDRLDTDPALAGTIDNFRLVGQSGDLGWAAAIDGTLLEDGTVAARNIQTGLPTGLDGIVTHPNSLVVGFSTTAKTTHEVVTPGTDTEPPVVRELDSPQPNKTQPPTHAAGSFDLSFADGRAVGAFDIERDGRSQ